MAQPPAQQQNNVSIIATNPRIEYRGNWTVQENGAYQFTTTPGSGFVFRFNGTSIYYYATIDSRAATLLALLDTNFTTSGSTFDGSLSAVSGANVIPAVLYSKEGLDPTVEHVLNVSWLGPGSQGGPYGELYTLGYTQDNINDTLGNGTSTSSTPSSSTSPGSSSKSKSNNRGAIAGGVIGGLAALALIAALVLLFLRRRRTNSGRINGDGGETRQVRNSGVSPYTLPQPNAPGLISTSNYPTTTITTTSPQQSNSSPINTTNVRPSKAALIAANNNSTPHNSNTQTAPSSATSGGSAVTVTPLLTHPPASDINELEPPPVYVDDRRGL